MRGLLKSQRSAMKRACWTAGFGGAGVLSTLAVMHGPTAPAAIAVGAGAAVASNAVAELSAALPGVIAALSAKKVARIKAKTDSEVALEEARRRTALVNAGLEGKLDAAIDLLKLQVIDAQVLAGRRLSEGMLRELLPQPRAAHDEDSGLAVIQPGKPGAAARHAKPDTQPMSSLPSNAAAPRPVSSSDGASMIG